MVDIRKIELIEALRGLKEQYISQATAPLDGMWLCGFVPAAEHFGFYEKTKLVGYFCIDHAGYLLQFYLPHNYYDQASCLFDRVLKDRNVFAGKVNGAFVSTAEPQYLSLCLDHCSIFNVHAFMYQLDRNACAVQGQQSTVQVEIVKSVQLEELIDFAKTNAGGPEQWLRGYYTNLIDRQELFGVWENGRLLAAGECRGYDEYQTDFADLGIIVDKSARGKGLGTHVLKQLVKVAEAKGLIPICSTEKGNIGAQKAIRRAGFVADNRIIQFDI